jgi:hypothetical protein
MSDKYPPRSTGGEEARLIRLLQDTRYELEGMRTRRRQEKLRIIDFALSLAAGPDPSHWRIADQLRELVDVPGHPDDVKP